MSAVLRDTTIYSNYFVHKYLADTRLAGGRLVPLPFAFTVQSASTVGDTYNLLVIPAYARVVGLECVTDGLGASGGVNCTCSIGDSGSATRYMIATDFDVTGATGRLAIGGAGYTPTSDTIVLATIGTAAAVVGKSVAGCLFIVPGA